MSSSAVPGITHNVQCPPDLGKQGTLIEVYSMCNVDASRLPGKASLKNKESHMHGSTYFTTLEKPLVFIDDYYEWSTIEK
jgi:hypothetical protein